MANTTTFGATIVPTPDHRNNHYLDSPSLTPVASRDESAADFYARPANTQSPLYQSSPVSQEKGGKLNLSVFEKDVESGNATPLSAHDEQNPFSKSHKVQSNCEDTMWPSKLTLKQKKKAEKQTKRDERGVRGCAPLRNRWSRLSKRNRILIQVGLALFIIGVAVAIGVGISSAVKGTYFVGDGDSKAVGQ